MLPALEVKIETSAACLMASNPRLSRLWIIAALLAGGIPAHAQSTSPPIDPAISKLAARIAEPLQKANATKVVVADLRGPEGQAHPIGKYLADQLSASLQKDFPNLQVIDRPQQNTDPNEHAHSGDEGRDLKEMKKWARDLGANVVITGSFAKVSLGIGVSLGSAFCNGSRRSPAQATGLIPITDEIAAVSADPIPSPKDGIAGAGRGGTTVPTCVYCPDPLYTSAARAAKYQGRVVLNVVVTAEGRATDIHVAKGTGLGLEENAIEAVKKWRFKPAVGPDGNPVAVSIPIEVTFRLYFSSPNSPQATPNPPSSAEHERIQNVAPEEAWKRVMECVFPTYPGLAFDSQITGTVDIGLGISPNGDVANYRVLDGPPLLVQSAVDAIQQWKFRSNEAPGAVTWSRVRALLRFNADGTTVVDLSPAILPDDFGDAGTPRSSASEFPRPATAPSCKSGATPP
jgi:TonB family protein